MKQPQLKPTVTVQCLRLVGFAVQRSADHVASCARLFHSVEGPVIDGQPELQALPHFTSWHNCRVLSLSGVADCRVLPS